MKTSAWTRTGECRIVPWYFGLMRAEFEERRDTKDIYGVFGDTFQIRWVRAGRLPTKFDNPGPFGFLSTVATTPGDTRTFGDRALWRGFITYFKGNGDEQRPAN